MVSAISAASGFASGISSPEKAQESAGQSDVARIKAEIISLKSELQCTECEDDQEDIRKTIETLETQLRRAQSDETVSKVKTNAASSSKSEGPGTSGGHKPEPGDPGFLLDMTV